MDLGSSRAWPKTHVQVQKVGVHPTGTWIQKAGIHAGPTTLDPGSRRDRYTHSVCMKSRPPYLSPWPSRTWSCPDPGAPGAEDREMPTSPKAAL